MPDLDELVTKLREELDAEKAEAQKRHDELLDALRESETPDRRGSGARTLRRAYEGGDDE